MCGLLSALSLDPLVVLHYVMVNMLLSVFLSVKEPRGEPGLIETNLKITFKSVC